MYFTKKWHPDWSLNWLFRACIVAFHSFLDAKTTYNANILCQQGRGWTGLFCWANFPVLEDGWAPPYLALTDVRQVASLALRPPLASKKRPNRIPGVPPGSFLKMLELFTIWMDDRGQEKLGVVARDCADSIPDHCSGLSLFSALALIDIYFCPSHTVIRYCIDEFLNILLIQRTSNS